MARRFYDTGLINQSWYIELEPKFKALYIHLLCVCDNVGIFEITPRMFSCMIGDNITIDDIFTRFGNRIRKLSDSKAILVDFVTFQCGGELRQGCRPHDSILKRLNEVGLPIEDLKQMTTKELKFIPLNSNQTVTKVLKIKTENKKEIKIETKKEDPKFDIDEHFNEFWKEYPNKASKAGAKAKMITRLAEKGTISGKEELFAKIMESLRKHKQTAQWLKDDGQFVPMAQTWLNQRRYEDEVDVTKGKASSNGIRERIKVADNFYSEAVSADKNF